MPEFKTKQALVLGTRPLSEHAFITSLFTAEYGRYLGVVKSKTAPQPGSFVQARWQARLSEHLGTYYLEPEQNPAILYMDDKKRLACILSLCSILNELLPERQAFPEFYQKIMSFFNQLNEKDVIAHYIQIEFDLLSALGFGLDTSACAGGGDASDLAYISPKTGRAVSREKGMPYHTRLLLLPPFLWKKSARIEPNDLTDGLHLTGYFLVRHAGLKKLPAVRDQLL